MPGIPGMPGGGGGRAPPGYAMGLPAIMGGGTPAGRERPIPRPAGAPRPGPGASCVLRIYQGGRVSEGDNKRRRKDILTALPCCAVLSCGGGAITLRLTTVSPRRMMRPNVRFCSGSGTLTASSSSSSAPAPSALDFAFLLLRFRRRNSSAAEEGEEGVLVLLVAIS